MEKAAGTRLLEALRSTVPSSNSPRLFRDPLVLEGRRFLEVTLLLFVVAVATARPSLYAATALLLGLYAVAHLGALYAALSLTATWSCPARVYAGEAFPVRLTLRNRGRATLLGVEVHAAGAAAPGPATVVERLPPGSAVSLEVPGRVRRRGLDRVPAPGLLVRWPFPLAYHLRRCGPSREVLAYARRAPVPARALHSPSRDLAPRETVAATSRGGEIIRGVREWTAGDPPRAIAWRATARHGRLLTREFEEEDGDRAVVLLEVDGRDLPARERRAAIERACSLATSLLLRLRARGRRTAFAAWIPEPVLVPSVASSAGIARALEAIALLEPPRRRDPRRDPLALLPAPSLRGARVLKVVAAHGGIRTVRGPRGTRVTVVPALRAAFEPGRAE